MTFKQQIEKEKERGFNDGYHGKPIDTFYSYLGRRTERLRASYEIGWRLGKAEKQYGGKK